MMKKLLYVTVFIAFVSCSKTHNASQVEDNKLIVVDTVRVESDSLAVEDEYLDQETVYNFGEEISLIKVHDNDSVIGVISRSDGCIKSFDVDSKAIIDECVFKIFEGGLYLFHASTNDSLYFLSYGDENFVKTEIFDFNEDTLVSIDDMIVSDASKNYALLNEIEFIEPSSNTYLLNLKTGVIDTLNIRGKSLFIDEDQGKILISKILNDGFTEYIVYNFLTMEKLSSIKSKGTLKPFAVDILSSNVLCSDDNKSNIYSVNLNSGTVKILYEIRELYNPMYLSSLNTVCFIGSDKTTVEFKVIGIL